MEESLKEQYVRLCRELVDLQIVQSESRELEILAILDDLWYKKMSPADREYAKNILDSEIRNYRNEIFDRNIG